jgi:hypothetical protein
VHSISPGERNPVEGKFDQAKTGYGLNRIKARLRDAGESRIAGILLALNPVVGGGGGGGGSVAYPYFKNVVEFFCTDACRIG